KCTDASGIASVAGEMNSISYTGTKLTDSTYTIAVSDLTQGKYDTVKITVTDKSLRANKATQNIMIKYDSTLEDKDGPTITKISGADTVSSASYTLVDSIYDPSGVDSVSAVLNSGTKTILTGTGNKYTFAGTLQEGLNTIVVTAKDKAAAGNTSTQTKNVLYIVKTVITTDLSAQTACPGTAVSLSVAASGTRPLTYKWYKDNETMSISSDSVYKISSSFALTDTGYYKLIVSNWAGADTSASAKVSVTKYTVTFSTGVSTITVSSQSVICGSNATEPTEPTRSGYIFAGWYPSSTSTTEYSFFTAITANTTIYAKWTAVYTVTYNGNGNTGGSVPTDASSYVSGSTVKVLSNTLSRTHYTFSKWNTSSDGSGDSYSAGDYLTMGSSNVNLYAQWVLDTFTVYFNSQGAETDPSYTSKKVIYGSTISSFPSDPVKTSCTFAGWWSNTVGRGDSIKSSTVITSNDTVYAKWTITDANENVYKTILIGNQTWMAENLRTTKYRNGSSFSYFYWPNDDSSRYSETYGALYYKDVVSDSMAPTGWHVSTLSDWNTLISFLGDSAGGKLKDAGTNSWASPNTGATNKYNFTALPSGYVSVYRGDAKYYAFDSLGCWGTTNGDYIKLHYDSYNIDSSSYSGTYMGFSIRCVRDY
ncbi:MAG TPA: hypothetical protein DCO75_02250, partial [Fibrobacteres bacterium]|nr:hypothetical protein [Fibrobacterota bacterium]